MQRTCRKCRQVFESSLLVKVNGEYRCASPCKNGKPAGNNKKQQAKELAEVFMGEIEEVLEKDGYKFATIEDQQQAQVSITGKPRSYVFTCAVSNAPVEEAFLKALQVYCHHNNSELVIVPIKYKLAAGVDYVWDVKVAEYFSTKRIFCNSNLLMAGEINILPTASVPLSGMESIGRESSVIVAHPKIQLEAIATPHNKVPKLMLTTGAVTKQNYTISKAGQKAEFHHSLGAVVVEVVNDTNFHVRHLHWSEKHGNICDLNKVYTPEGVNYGQAEALILGDAHIGWFCPKVYQGTFSGQNSIQQLTQPKYLVWHDLLDQYARNHHHQGDPFNAIAKQKSGKDNVRKELDMVATFIAGVDQYSKAEHIIVGSNHNDALSRWIKDCDWREDPLNAETYLETALAMARASRMSGSGASTIPAFDYWMQKLIPDTVEYTMLGRDESLLIKGIEIGFHGDKGANGARGNARQFARTGSKFVIGHSHTPRIFEGCYQVGTSTKLKLEYNSGLSNWLNSHCLIYPNGKRQLIHLIDGEFTSF